MAIDTLSLWSRATSHGLKIVVVIEAIIEEAQNDIHFRKDIIKTKIIQEKLGHMKNIFNTKCFCSAILFLYKSYGIQTNLSQGRNCCKLCVKFACPSII